MPIYSWIFSVSPTYLQFSTTVLFLFRVGQNPTPYYFLVQNIAIPKCQLQHHICIHCLDQSKQALVLLIETVFISLPSAELTLVFCFGLFLDARESQTCLWTCWREFSWSGLGQHVPLLSGKGSHDHQGPTPHSEQWLFAGNGVEWDGQRSQWCFLCSVTPAHSHIMHWSLFICQSLGVGNQNYIRYTLCIQRVEGLEEIDISEDKISASLDSKVSHCFHCFPIYLPWSDGTGCHDLSFLNAEL